MKIAIVALYLITKLNCQVDPSFEGQKQVTQLTTENFDKLVLQNPDKKWAVLIQSPNCIHCQKFKPTYYKIAYDLQNSDVQFAEINCREQKNLCTQLRINSYPQLWMMNQNQMYKFVSSRNEPIVKRFIQKEWSTNQAKIIPDKMPSFLDSFVEGFSSFKEEIQLVFKQDGNYLAKGIFGLIIFMIITIISITLYMCFQVVQFLKPVEYPEQSNEKKIKKD